MRKLYYLLLPVLLASVACNALASTAASPPPPTSEPSATTAPTSTPTPEPAAFVPERCRALPVATLPAATTVALPTPRAEEDPQLSAEDQLGVLNGLVAVVKDVYLYEEAVTEAWLGDVEVLRIRVQHGLDTKVFYEKLRGLVDALGDEHSTYESPTEVAASEVELAGSIDYVGIGALLQPLAEEGRVTVVSVFEDSPAAHGGLDAHDSILAVDGLPIVENGVAHPERTRGPECSAVVLTVQTPGRASRRVTLIRSRVTTPLPINARLVATSNASRVGYLFIPTLFDQTIPEQVRRALEEFGPLDGLIIDNRMNGGGSSTVTESILGFFASGVLGHFMSREGERPLEVAANPIHNSQDVPMVVLVGEDTASYGEIFSGVLQDLRRARLVGQTTRGNVEVLHGYKLQDGSVVWIAEEKFDPLNSDADWEAQGIIPEVEVVSAWSTYTFETDPAISAALNLLGNQPPP